MKVKEFSIAKEFSIYPGPRYIKEGPFSGELFRTTILEQLVKECLQTGIKLQIDLDDTTGYSTGFLEESFGGLIRKGELRFDEIDSILIFKSDDEPYLINEIVKCIEDCKEGVVRYAK